MTRFIGPGYWKFVAEKVKNAAKIRAALAYVTRREPLSFHEGDVLIVDASDHAIASGQTSAHILEQFFEKGVELYSVGGLHAKVIIAGDVVFAGSANLSEHSVAGYLIEGGIETNHPTTVSSALAFINSLKKQGKRCDDAFISSILKIKVKPKPFNWEKAHKAKQPKLSKDSTNWLICCEELLKDLDNAERTEVGSGETEASKHLLKPNSKAEWLQYPLSSKMAKRIAPGDVIVLISTEASSTSVYRHARVLDNRIGKKHRWIFYEEPHGAHQQTLPWTKFKDLCKKAGLPSAPSVNSERRLRPEWSEALHTLWNQARKK